MLVSDGVGLLLSLPGLSVGALVGVRVGTVWRRLLWEGSAHAFGPRAANPRTPRITNMTPRRKVRRDTMRPMTISSSDGARSDSR